MGVELVKRAVDLGIVTNNGDMPMPGIKIAMIEDPDGNWVELLSM